VANKRLLLGRRRMLKALSFAAVFLVRDLWSLQLFCGRPSTVPTDSTAAEFDFLLRNLAHSFCYFYDGGGFKNTSLASIFDSTRFEPPSFRNEKQNTWKPNQ